MKQKLTMIILGIVGIGCFILLNGCAPALQVGAGLVGEGIGNGMSNKDKEWGR